MLEVLFNPVIFALLSYGNSPFHHVTDPDKIAPYEVAGFPNYPGSSNLLYLPTDLYYTIQLDQI